MGFILIVLAAGSLAAGMFIIGILTLVTLLVNRKVNMPYVLPAGIVLFLLLFPLQESLEGVFHSASSTSGAMNDVLEAGLFVPGTLIVLLYWLVTVWIDYFSTLRTWPLAILFTVLTACLLGQFAVSHQMSCFPLFKLVVVVSVAIKCWGWYRETRSKDATD